LCNYLTMSLPSYVAKIYCFGNGEQTGGYKAAPYSKVDEYL